MYKITRLFIGGLLCGLRHTSYSSVSFPVGWECLNPVGGSPYRIVECEYVGA